MHRFVDVCVFVCPFFVTSMVCVCAISISLLQCSTKFVVKTRGDRMETPSPRWTDGHSILNAPSGGQAREGGEVSQVERG